MKLFIIALTVTASFCSIFQYQENASEMCIEKCLKYKNYKTQDSNTTIKDCYKKCINTQSLIRKD